MLQFGLGMVISLIVAPHRSIVFGHTGMFVPKNCEINKAYFFLHFCVLGVIVSPYKTPF